MKIFALLVSIFVATAANAADHLVYEVAESYWEKNPEARFAVNKDKTETFVMFTTTSVAQDPRREIKHDTKVKVDGLEIRDSNKITLDKDGALVECANVFTRGVSIFRYNKVVETGCTLKVTTVRKPFSDGVRIRKMRVHQVFLVTK